MLRILLREDKKKRNIFVNIIHVNMRRQTFEYGAETQARPADEQRRCHLMLDCAAISLRRRLFDHGSMDSGKTNMAAFAIRFDKLCSRTDLG